MLPVKGKCVSSPKPTSEAAGLLVGPWFWKKALLWYALAAFVIAFDLLTKAWALASFQYAQPVEVTPFFDWLLLYNYGAAFSFLSEEGGWQRWFFSAIAVGVSCMLVLWLARIRPEQRWEPIALALILGGALGNLYDRLTLGYVVDFISLHYQQHRWPSFNIADSAICAGAVMLLIDLWRSKDSDVNE